MKKNEFAQQKRVPRYLVPFCNKGRTPGMIKRDVAHLFGRDDVPWRLFAEGLLRNRHFHEEVFLRGPRCLACERRFNREDGQVHSRIEKHHADYLHRCTGTLLEPGHTDIYRPALPGEFEPVPDCRTCHQDRPTVFEQCLKRLYPVHASCHERIHEKEHYLRHQAKARLQAHFRMAARTWLPPEFDAD